MWGGASYTKRLRKQRGEPRPRQGWIKILPSQEGQFLAGAPVSASDVQEVVLMETELNLFFEQMTRKTRLKGQFKCQQTRTTMRRPNTPIPGLWRCCYAC